jgi:D-sedoheptulose 7-phosphate isomerase
MFFKKFIKEDIDLAKKLSKLEKKINISIEVIFKALSSGKKVFICGNGGSAADAEHLSAEFLIRLRPNINRKSYPVIALTQSSSVITACSNDYGFVNIFKRNLEGLYNDGDLLICLSTSGNSKNIKNVLSFSKKKNINTLAFFGKKKGICHGIADYEIIIPSANTAKIQESYMKLCHYIFARVEDRLLV